MKAIAIQPFITNIGKESIELHPLKKSIIIQSVKASQSKVYINPVVGSDCPSWRYQREGFEGPCKGYRHYHMIHRSLPFPIIMRDITIGVNIQITFFFFIIENRWRQAWTRVLWKTLQRFSSTSTKWARTNLSVLSILCGASLKMTNIFEADVCGSFDCTSSSSLRSRQLWARACKFVIFPLKVFFITHQTT